MKNNRPACILMFPGKYGALLEMLSDYILQEEAEERMVSYDPQENMGHEAVMKSFGITKEDLADVDVEIE